MKRSYKALALFMATAAFAACSNDENGIPTPDQNDGTNVRIQLKNGVTTRATEAGTTEENELKTLEIFVFNSDSTRDTKTPYFKPATLSGSNSYSVPVKSGTDKYILVVANAGLDTLKTAAGAYENMDAVLKTLVGTLDKSNSTKVPAAGFQMSGLAKFSVDEGATASTTVDLARFAAKIYAPVVATNLDIQLPNDSLKSLFGTNFDGTVAGTTYSFNITGYAVINGLQKSDVWDGLDNQGNFTTWVMSNYFNGDGETVAPTVNLYDVATYDANGNFLSVYSGLNGSSWFQTPTGTTWTAPYIYAYENQPYRVLNGGAYRTLASTVYAFIVEGKLSAQQGLNTYQSQPRYWRVNFYTPDVYKIQRNSAYYITLNKIITAGFGNPKAAEKDQPWVPDPNETNVDITISVLQWNVLSSSTQM